MTVLLMCLECTHVQFTRPTPGKEKEASARSCHQEVLRQSKAAWAAAAAAAAASQQTAAAAAASGSSRPAAETSSSPSGSNDPTTAAGAFGAADQAAAASAAAGIGCVLAIMPGANGYLAAAGLVLQLNLPELAAKLLELAAGERRQALGGAACLEEAWRVHTHWR